MGHDEYLPCSSYENQPAHESEAGFAAFYDEKSEQHFFALLDADGKTLLRSEGYPQTPARENGIQSVIKNRSNKDFYSVKEEDGAYFLCLRAANYREIARSCPCESEAAALELIPYMTGEKIRGGVNATAATTVTSSKSENSEDDYLACRQYDGHGEADENGFVRWQHSNEQYYFTWVNDKGSVKMRSEGYPTAAARDNGMNSVIKNWDNKDRYVVKEMNGKHFVILKAGNHKEIARSCPKDSLDAVGLMFPLLGVGAAALSLIDTPSVSKPTVDIVDDYLPCREYHGHMTAPRDGFRVFISPRTDKYYFAVVDKDDDVSLRSEGYLTAKERDADLDDVVKNMHNKEHYEIKKADFNHYYVILKNDDGKEIARSCTYNSLAAIYSAIPFLDPAHADAEVGLGAPLAMTAAAVAARSLLQEEPEETAPVAAAGVEEEAAKAGFGWWWLLLPLLALLAWWLLGSKGCGKTDAVVPPVITTKATDSSAKQKSVAVIDTTKKDVAITPPPPPPAAPSCDLNWIFFDFDKSDIRANASKELAEMAKILKENKDYVGVLSAHTDGKGTDEYNEALSSRRAENAKAALIKMGIAANRLSTAIEGKNAPVAKNTDDDNGRHYNRRVELYIRDKAGKDICKSVPPEIPTELKAQ